MYIPSYARYYILKSVHLQSQHFVFFLISVGRLMEIHGEGTSKGTVVKEGEEGEAVERPDGYEPPVLDTV